MNAVTFKNYLVQQNSEAWSRVFEDMRKMLNILCLSTPFVLFQCQAELLLLFVLNCHCAYMFIYSYIKKSKTIVLLLEKGPW